jgi:LTXXQ motif family protein
MMIDLSLPRIFVAATAALLLAAAPLRAAPQDDRASSGVNPVQLAQATATPAPATPAAPAHKSRRASRMEPDRVEARIKELHDKLQITDAQADQWNAVAQVMRDNASSMRSLAATRTQNAGGMTAIDDLRSYQQITEAHADGLKKFVSAFQTLYDSMSDAQKKTADAVFAQRQKQHAHRGRS